MSKSFLTEEELISISQSGMHFGANHMPENQLRRMIDRIRKRESVLGEDSIDSKNLGKLLIQGLGLFQENTVEQLSDCEVYVLPEPVCIANSRMIGERNIILISTGMLDLLFAMANWAQVAETLPQEFEQIFPFEEWPNVSATSGFSVFSYILIYQYYQFGETLPNFSEILKEDDKKWVKNGMISSVLFLLFHELGHHELHHLSGREAQTTTIHTILEEDLSAHQKKELEADWFVYQCLKPEAKKVFQTFMIMGLNFHSIYESVLSVSGDEHPLTLNRLYHAEQNVEKGLFDKSLLDIDAHLNSQAKAFKNIADHNKEQGGGFNARFLKDCSRDEVIGYLRKLTPHFNKAGLDIETIIQSSSPNWKDSLSL